MKIALPSSGNLVDEHFGHCEFFTIFDIDNQQIVSEQKLQPPPGCGCKSNIVPQLADLGVTVMLAGNMGGGAVNMLNMHGIQVIRGCSGDLKQVVQAWLQGNLSDSGLGCQAHGDEGCDHH